MGGSELLSLHIAFVHLVFVRSPLESAFVGDHFGICFMKIDRIIPDRVMHAQRFALKKVPYKHMAINFYGFFYGDCGTVRYSR